MNSLFQEYFLLGMNIAVTVTGQTAAQNCYVILGVISSWNIDPQVIFRVGLGAL